LVIHYGDPFVTMTDAGPKAMTSNHIVGQQHRPIAVRATGRTGVIIARFFPWSASAILPMPLSEFTDGAVALSDVWSSDTVQRLLEQVELAKIPRLRAKVVDQFIVTHLCSSEPDLSCKLPIEMMNGSWGRQKVDNIAMALGVSRRQLGRRFDGSVGMTPKKMSCILRAQKAIACLRAGRHAHDVVALCGYVDQSHLIHHVVGVTGKRPSEIAAAGNSNLQRHFNAQDTGAFCGQAYL
jgi:AraC-like DNA-binding protein